MRQKKIEREEERKTHRHWEKIERDIWRIVQQEERGERDRKRDKVIKINIVIKRRTEREER